MADQFWLGTVGPFYGKVSSNSAPAEDEEMVRKVDLEGSTFGSKCRVFLSGNYQVAHNSEVVIPFDYASYDIKSEYNFGLRAFTSENSGYYIVMVKFTLDLTGAVGGDVAIYINRIGGRASGIGYKIISGMTYQGFMLSDAIYLQAGYSLNCSMIQTSGIARWIIGGSPYTYLTIIRVS